MSQPGIHVVPVVSRADLKRFIDLPFQLYQGNRYWVPPIKRMEMAQFDPRKNPAFDHCEAQLYLALRQSKVLGRIAVIINHKEQEISGQNVARFGWLDFVDDTEVSQALFQQVEAWSVAKGCVSLKGPYGFSNMDKAGMLIEGFEELSTMAVIYNHPYYPQHMEWLGYQKLVDWKEFEAKVPDSIPERVIKLANLIQNRYQLSEYKPRKKADLHKVGQSIFELINLAYRDLEGFIPHTDRQIELFIDQYLSMINPDFISIIMDKDQQLAGFGITMPSFSRALQKAQGKLFPTGFWQLQKAMRKNDRADLYLIAVRPDLQNKGITALIFKKIIETFIRYGIEKAETNPELESNQDVQNLWKGYDIRLHKRRRCYIKPLQ